MKNIVKFTIFGAALAMSSNADAKTLAEILAEDNAKDPYALQDQVYQSNEHGEAAEAPKANSFELKETTTTVYEEPAPMRILDPNQEEGLTLQKFNARDNTGIKRIPTHRRNNVFIPAPEYK